VRVEQVVVLVNKSAFFSFRPRRAWNKCSGFFSFSIIKNSVRAGRGTSQLFKMQICTLISAFAD
jgi:hypothetical protein